MLEKFDLVVRVQALIIFKLEKIVNYGLIIPAADNTLSTLFIMVSAN
jgi:hypothetical protein